MSLRRVFTVFLLALFGITAMMLFQVSQAVQRKERQLAEKQYQLSQIKEAQRVMRAEWAYLNRPDRLEVLARDVLGYDAPSLEKLTGDVATVPEPFSPSILPPRRSASMQGADNLSPSSIFPEKKNLSQAINHSINKEAP